jgi:hypothetical protein
MALIPYGNGLIELEAPLFVMTYFQLPFGFCDTDRTMA